MKQYCAYLRKSRADRDAELLGEEDVLKRHKRLLCELAKKMNITISKFYSEVVSGDTIDERPVMQELLSDVESGMWTGVLVVEVERLARGNTRDQGIVADTFKYSDTIIVTPSKTYDPNNEFDEEYFEFGLFMSRREYKTINRRLQRGRLSSVDEGKFIGSTAPYGYNRVKIPHEKGYTLEIIPEEAKIVQQIFEWYCYGDLLPDGSTQFLGTSLIAAKLDAMGVKPRNSEHWSKASIRDMLRNELYTGYITWGKDKDIKVSEGGKVIKKRTRSENYKRTKGLHSAIIDLELFNLTQTRLIEMRTKTSPGTNTLQNKLSGIVFCKKCGQMMTRLGENSHNKYATLKCPNRYCNNVSSPIFLIENQILNFLQEWLDNYNFDYSSVAVVPLQEQLESKKALLKKVISEISGYESQMNKAYDLLEREIYTLDIFQQRKRTISDSITKLNESRLNLIQDIDNITNLYNQQIMYMPKIKHLLETYHTNTPEVSNHILKEILDKVYYEKNEPNRKGQINNCNFSLEIYPRVPK